jgi:hypothetical protein
VTQGRSLGGRYSPLHDVEAEWFFHPAVAVKFIQFCLLAFIFATVNLQITAECSVNQNRCLTANAIVAKKILIRCF